jgi:multidrug efflux system membrane fusion protein
VSERKLAGLSVGAPAEVRLITGQTAQGHIRYVSKSASDKTRTYRVEVEIPNPDGTIPDGITCEVKIKMAPVEAVHLPRSALTFSSAGDLGVRTVDDTGLVAFVPVDIAEDEQNSMWVNGVAENAQVIIEGQDFVREGEKVDVVKTAERTAQQ